MKGNKQHNDSFFQINYRKITPWTSTNYFTEMFSNAKLAADEIIISRTNYVSDIKSVAVDPENILLVNDDKGLFQRNNSLENIKKIFDKMSELKETLCCLTTTKVKRKQSVQLTTVDKKNNKVCTSIIYIIDIIYLF